MTQCDTSIRRWFTFQQAMICCLPAMACAVCMMFSCSSHAQALQERLDSERYVRGLRELQLPEVLEHYLAMHPAAGAVDAALADIALKQAQLSAMKSAAARLQAIEAILAAREDVLARNAADARRAVWLADQASDLYFELLQLDALHLTALFGLPDDQQRVRAAEAASRMNDFAQQAEQAIDVAIRAVESSPDYARDPRLQQRRRELADVERDRRIPFLRGVGAFLHAELNLQGPAQRSSWELAAQTLTPLNDRLDGSLALAARLYDGYAQARLGRFDAAEAQFASVARDADAAPADVFAARMGGVMNRLVRSGPQSALEGLASIEDRYREPDMLFYRVLLADQRFRLLRQQALAASPADRARLVSQAFAAYTDLMRLTYPPGSISRETLRAIAFARLSTAASGVDMPTAQLPAIVTIAMADARSRNPATREQAIVALEGVLTDASVPAEDRASALFSLGRALYEADQPLFAARRFMELARDHPADAQAERSMELAATLAWSEWEVHRRSSGYSQSDARVLLRETLDVLLARYPNLPSIDRWQYAAGRLAMTDDRFNDAMQHFAKVTPTASQWPDANFMQAASARERATKLATGAAVQAMHQQTLDVIARVQPVLEQALAAAANVQRRAAMQYYLAMLRVYRAEAMLGMGDALKAIDALAGIEHDTTIGSDALGEAMRVRINAYQVLRKPDDALRDLQRFVETSPAQAGAVLGPMTASLTADVNALLEAGREQEATQLAARTLLPAAKSLEAWLSTADAPRTGNEHAALERRVADAYRLAGEFVAAAAIYQRLLRVMPDAAEVLLGEAECLFGQGGEGRLAQAMTIYRRLAAAGPAAGHEAYWLSQLRMLEILDLTERGTHQIVPRIERLRQGDPDFGGERYRRGFEALRLKHASG